MVRNIILNLFLKKTFIYTNLKEACITKVLKLS